LNKGEAKMIYVKKGKNNKTGAPIAIIDGDTRPVYKQLGRQGLGFRWWARDKFWYMPESRFTPDKLQKLIVMGADISGYTGQKTPERPGRAPEPSKIEKGVEVRPEEKDVSKINTDKTTGKTYSTSFPVNENIYSTDIDVNVEGQDLTLRLIVGRKQDAKYTKTKPILTFDIFIDDELVKKYGKQPGRWTRAGMGYDEDAIVAEFVDRIPKMIANKEKSKLYLAIKYVLELKKRDPELAQFLKNWYDWKYDKNKDVDALVNRYIPQRMISLDEAGYSGSFPLKFELLSGTIYVHTDVDHPLAPYPKTLSNIGIPATIRNFVDLNNHIDRAIAEDLSMIKEDYLKYLKSFAYTQEQEEETRGEMEEIAKMIEANFDNIEFFKRELMKRQFVRPSKRGKKVGPGMVPMGVFKLIIDDKAIRNAAFKRDNSPDYFYSALAYNLMRIKHGNIGFMPILLIDAYRDVSRTVTRYGHNISPTQVADFIDNTARKLYADLTGRTYKSWDERWTEFYSGWGTSGTSVAPGQVISPGAIQDWISFVSNYGFGEEEARNNAKIVYRQLALRLHPDVYQGDKEEGERLFKELDDKYKSLPPDMQKGASNWYRKIKITSIK